MTQTNAQSGEAHFSLLDWPLARKGVQTARVSSALMRLLFATRGVTLYVWDRRRIELIAVAAGIWFDPFSGWRENGNDISYLKCTTWRCGHKPNAARLRAPSNKLTKRSVRISELLKRQN